MKNNQLMCDMETGICGEATDGEMELIDLSEPNKTVDLYYVTDPICSHCWALEPVLRRFKEQYGQYFHIKTVMGGLLEKWGDGPVDPANGIFKPADVAGHWREVGEHARMPIDGSLMIDNPVQSSYPPSRVYKVIEKNYGSKRADEYLRRSREALFAFNKNISEEKVMIDIVNRLGLDGEAIVKEAEGEVGNRLLHEDFALAAKLGVRGFPSIVIVNEDNQGVKVVGARPLETYVAGLNQVLAEEDVTSRKQPTLSVLLQKEKLLFSKEIEVMYDLEKDNVKEFIVKELPANSYEIKELLGELYVESK